MSVVADASRLSLASLSALMGRAAPQGASAAPVSPALAMRSAANEAAAVEVAAPVQSEAAAGGAAGGSLTSALLALSTLDPGVELERLAGGIGAIAAVRQGPGRRATPGRRPRTTRRRH